MESIRFIDLFAGMGGIRLGLQQACIDLGIHSHCVFTSEIKSAAISVYKQNFPSDVISGDITKISSDDIPDFDILLAGFPCQAFSYAGNRDGFADATRGTLFFDVLRILREKKPMGFILENVEGLVSHDGGRTFKTIISSLEEQYKVSYSILNAKSFGVPQDRKRIYIVGVKKNKRKVSLENFSASGAKIGDILEKGLPISKTPFMKKLLSHYSVEELEGKKIKDKRGGSDNIHSWDMELKGRVSKEQKELLNEMLKARRQHKWAEEWGIDWMDGMPLTETQISTFYSHPRLGSMLEDLTKKGYLVYEYPKKKVVSSSVVSGREVKISRRVPDETKPKGYNIVAGKLSFEVSEILSRKSIAPTLVAMDMHRIHVVDGTGVRKLSLREGLRLFGYPDNYKFSITEKEGYDLLGNTVVVPVIKAVAKRLISSL
ncbi:MAG: DNA (cytosine-5-)-methyltransferase [Bacteroidales bacterium]|nr:DNA (cytosine-5-)-methyltransferase [Bacteroidales bacterium]